MVITTFREDVRYIGEVVFGLTIFILGWMVFLKMLF
jgi:hypothetical protein